MEQEKKQNAQKNDQAQPSHHKKHRHKSYFIDPNAPQAPKQESKAATKDAPKETQKPAASAPAKDGQGNAPSNHSRNRHRNRNRNKNRPAQANGAEAQATAPQATTVEKIPAPTEQKNTSHQKGGNKQNQRRGQDTILKDVSPRVQKPTSSAEQLNGDYEEIFFPSIDEPSSMTLTAKTSKEESSEEEASPLVEVVGIRFKSSGKVYYFAPAGKQAKKGDYAIVETARGLEYGEIALANSMVKESDTVPPLRSIVRIATEADRKHHEDNKKKEEDAFRICNEKIAAHGLDMKLIDAQYTFDNSKLLFYFTSAGRVDFRDLVKDLAGVFRTRIELRQIGIRDEAKLMGGMGPCGRSLCCTRFLSDFGQVSIKMAKEQNLSLNSSKISGICGRLMCCLRYEQETYEYELKRTPPVGATVRTPDGLGTVTEISPLIGTVKVRLSETPETPPKAYRREELVQLKKKQEKKEKQEK